MRELALIMALWLEACAKPRPRTQTRLRHAKTFQRIGREDIRGERRSVDVWHDGAGLQALSWP